MIGSTVTLGLGTHDMEVQAWITFPAIGITHEEDPDRTTTCLFYREIETKTKHFELITLLSVHNPKHLKGKVIEVRNDGWGCDMVLIEFNSPTPKRRWFCPFLLNCPALEIQE